MLRVRTLILLSMALAGLAGQGHAQNRPIHLTDAAQRGTFSVGAAQATETTVFDPELDQQVIRLAYALPPGTSAGLWAKEFPAGLVSDNAGLLTIHAKASAPDQLAQLSVAVEIKGSGATQRVGLALSPAWNQVEQAVEWSQIGSIGEVVVLVARSGGAGTLAGTLDVALRFEPLPLGRALSTHVEARLAGVFALGAMAGLLLFVAGGCCGWWQSTTTRAPRGLAGDFFAGGGAVFTSGVALAIFWLGERTGLEIGWTALGMAIAGGALGEWIKFGLTGRHVTPMELVRDMVVTGALAASSSSMALLQNPATWSEVLLLSRTTAAAAALVYHAASAYRLARSGRHLGRIGAMVILAAPYVVGSLLLLESRALVESLGAALTAGALSAWPALLALMGRFLVVLAVNEAVANGLSLLTARSLLRSARAHLLLSGVAAAAVTAPWIADWGSGAAVAAWPVPARVAAVLLATVLSQAGLWAEVYLMTGMVLDAIRGVPPSSGSAYAHPRAGIVKGIVYSGVFMALLYGAGMLAAWPGLQSLAAAQPLLVAALVGAAVFPLAKTIIESFDGSRAFFLRLRNSYRSPILPLRGLVAGLGVGAAVLLSLSEKEMSTRIWFGLAVGLAASAGVNLLRDVVYGLTARGSVRAPRTYLIDALLGGFVGAAIGFYLDAAQLAIVGAKFHRYLGVGYAPEPYGVYPFVSKWGFIDLGTVTGGAKLLLAESLAGVISWSIPAWLFALNKTFMIAYFQRETGPIKALFTRAGAIQLVENMIQVLRWGLWMSPIINSFLRPMGTPTWYNQDGAIRTLIAMFSDATMTPQAFHAWSLQVFIYLLAYDSVRVLIWLDHMGLRVATLVNLSFLGMDRLDQRVARWLGPAATARYIPEGVKRFTTWAPLLIPYYIPRGADWDYAWSQAEAIQRAAAGSGIGATLLGLPLPGKVLLALAATAGATAVFTMIRLLRRRRDVDTAQGWTLSNAGYEVVAKENGEIRSRDTRTGYDVTRRSYDLLDPAGRSLFLVDDGRVWPLAGNFPAEDRAGLRVEPVFSVLKISGARGDLHASIDISLPDAEHPVELWTIDAKNVGPRTRSLKLVPYLEWVLNRPGADRGHTQYNRLFAEMQYRHALHAVLARDKHSGALGFLAAGPGPEGFLTSRIDFIGRAGTLRAPRVLQTLAFTPPEDTDLHPTFDPIASLLLSHNLSPGEEWRTQLVIGMADDEEEAAELILRHLDLPRSAAPLGPSRRKGRHRIGHGEIPPGVPQPYTEFSADGRTMHVRTPFTPRPFDHTLSNALGQVTVVTNRGLHTTSSVNAQQNRLTPDCPDTVTRELPGEAIYLYDPDHDQWYAPTYEPLRDREARHEVAYGVDGTAVFRMSKGSVETELTVFVPPDEPASIYLLTVTNRGASPLRLRAAPYFQMVLADQPEHSGPLAVTPLEELNGLLITNPRNTFRRGPALVAMSRRAELVETRRGNFFGSGESVDRPSLVRDAAPDPSAAADDRTVAALLTTLEIPAGQTCSLAVVLGQTDTPAEARTLAARYQDVADARWSLDRTRDWWNRLMETVTVRTSSPAVDGYLAWLRYQALAERIWARRGFYQASGAFGFRDQLQDSVNLMWMEPLLARRQILLHARQQFLEGDTVHWFHLLQDGRTGFAARTHASDNLLWLAWAVAEYVHATGDASILGEEAPYLEAEQPLEPLPRMKDGLGFEPLRSARTDTVYRHCLRAIDLVLGRRLGAHGLPLMGAGDWNDGLDEIGAHGRGESVWLGFFLYYILRQMAPLIAAKEGDARRDHYLARAEDLRTAVEGTWREDRYLRAIHDDGTEIGLAGSGIWEIDALTAAWAVISGINPRRGRIVFNTAVGILEKENTILLGWPPLRQGTKPYLGRSSRYPEGVRENGMYCHGVQWLVGAARILAEQAEEDVDLVEARRYREVAYRLWLKISPIPHVTPDQIEIYGGQPNQQAADMVTTFDPGRMIWNGYTGAAGWMFRQALEGVIGARLSSGKVVLPADITEPRGDLRVDDVARDLSRSPLRMEPQQNETRQHDRESQNPGRRQPPSRVR